MSSSSSSNRPAEVEVDEDAKSGDWLVVVVQW